MKIPPFSVVSLIDSRLGKRFPDIYCSVGPRQRVPMESLLQFYRPLSGAIGDATGASDSLAHIHGGMIVLFVARLLTRRSLATWTPFLWVLAAALLKEVADRMAHGVWRMPDTAFDVINTIFWPFVLMVGLRWRRAHPEGGGSSGR